jgi:hypothetical protein
MTGKISRRGFLCSVAAAAVAPALPLKLVGGGKGGGPVYMIFEEIPLSDFGHEIPIVTTISWPGAEILREGAS